MQITKTFSKTYDIYYAASWQFTYRETMESRKKIYGSEHDTALKKCFMCGYEFKDEDIPWLGLVKNHKNVFLCKCCGKKVAE